MRQLNLGASDEPRRNSAMIALLVTVLMAMILYNSYAAFLTSCLAVREVQLPFQSLEEMYKTTEFKVTTVVGYKLQQAGKICFFRFSI